MNIQTLLPLDSSALLAEKSRLCICSKIIVTLFAITFSVAGFGHQYTRTDLTADVAPTAKHLDPNLVNAWGLSRSSASPWWISDNGTGLSTLYDLDGAPQTLVVTIPPPGKSGTSAPTGTVFNYTSEFMIQQQQGGTQAKAIFLFVTEDGTISGWNPKVNATNAVIAVNRSGKAIYKGCAIAQTRKGSRLYATNFQSGKVEVFDGAFNRIHLDEHAFRLDDHDFDKDASSINKNGSYVPFNIQNVGGNLVVTFAKKQAGAKDETAGKGLGRVVVFDVNGHKLLSLQHGPWMNAPWGIAMAPSDFGTFSHRLLIGNFGDGKINAFNPVSGHFVGSLLDANNKPNPLVIDGLWAISFGGGNLKSGALNELYFTAGPNDEANGLFGKLTAVEQKGNSE
ncbi:MAG: TIGR03118 family protein [Methylococcales bacterium]|nr:TIGR03118 family protein [Methylococcales bacterium]MDD5633585.1 TIGR03118 family protein [Methylococcales bacterium]